MKQGNDSFLEKINKYFFDDQSDLPIHFTKDEQEMIIRYRDTYVHWLSQPQKSDRDVVEYIIKQYDVSETTAYRDLPRIKLLLGNVQSASKEFHRHTANHMIREGYKKALDAKKLTEVKQALAMIRAGEALVRVNKLDKDELDDIPWDDIIPLNLEPSTDVSVIGRKRIPNLEEVQRKLRKKYGLLDGAEDAEYTELLKDENPLKESIGEDINPV